MKTSSSNINTRLQFSSNTSYQSYLSRCEFHNVENQGYILGYTEGQRDLLVQLRSDYGLSFSTEPQVNVGPRRRMIIMNNPNDTDSNSEREGE